ncbi:hypothetical protein Pcinc_015393 [Petrolisthes cinctipes]|uniref:Peptidase S1 domain-containing protein n=1 Tax=Petrolisthes cinctipes TaxID=88211 RepID=A0AAE1FQF6_PETCI|nr:hypothetical protein Pcinc_016768 [Petrolisthes cinctipes]KAK3880092.1 hypothetical protein Pcinc_015393 [Petrolisthes cinctipes]
MVGGVQPGDLRIAGGQNADKGQYPWLVSIEATNFEGRWLLCGGTLITPEWVLTAAHCLDSERPEWLWVVSGEHDTSIEEGTEQYLLVDYFVKHPEYIYWELPYHNDVALVHLSTPATLDEFTSLAPLPPSSTQALTSPCEEAGWGAMQEGGAGPSVLQWTHVDLFQPDLCEAAYPSFTPDPNILCAGQMSGGTGFCVGDNGGGLWCWNSEAGGYVVGGVVSWREGCAQPDNPGVYMDVASYKDWIINTINGSQQ